jgi:hypothetical protein
MLQGEQGKDKFNGAGSAQKMPCARFGGRNHQSVGPWSERFDQSLSFDPVIQARSRAMRIDVINGRRGNPATLKRPDDHVGDARAIRIKDHRAVGIGA